LAKIFGLFEIKINAISYYYIAMENLFYNTSNDINCYDLKGFKFSSYQTIFRIKYVNFSEIFKYFINNFI